MCNVTPYSVVGGFTVFGSSPVLEEDGLIPSSWEPPRDKDTSRDGEDTQEGYEGEEDGDVQRWRNADFEQSEGQSDGKQDNTDSTDDAILYAVRDSPNLTRDTVLEGVHLPLVRDGIESRRSGVGSDVISKPCLLDFSPDPFINRERRQRSP